MKTMFGFALVVLCLHSVCSTLDLNSKALTLNETLNLKASAESSDAGFGGSAPNSNGICVPPIRIDYGYRRYSSVYHYFYGVSQANCFAICQLAEYGCIAFNYKPSTKTCEILRSPGTLRTDTTQTTSLNKFVGSSVCNSANFLTGVYRGGSNYKYTAPGEITSATSCCYACLRDTPRCYAWDYHSSRRVCYMKYRVPQLYPDSYSVYTTGFGALCT